MFSLLRQYEKSQWLSASEISANQEASLTEILRYASRWSPYYRDRVLEAGLAVDRIDASDLNDLPTLTKNELVDHADELVTPRLPGTYSWKRRGVRRVYRSACARIVTRPRPNKPHRGVLMVGTAFGREIGKRVFGERRSRARPERVRGPSTGS